MVVKVIKSIHLYYENFHEENINKTVTIYMGCYANIFSRWDMQKHFSMNQTPHIFWIYFDIYSPYLSTVQDKVMEKCVYKFFVSTFESGCLI